MKKIQFRQTIQIGRNVTDIFNLPCVIRAEKLHNGTPLYLVATGTNMNEKRANIGDYICQDYNGHWYVIANDEH